MKVIAMSVATGFRLSSVFVLSLSLFLGAGVTVASQITYEMVTVGNPGNANDTGGTNNGAVAYSYQIGKYDVTIGQYTAFLNAADPNGTNPNNIYNSEMANDLNLAGISYTAGASAGAKYAVINNGGDSSNRPITYVSWFDAARFANWMTNGQGSGSTETGAYTLGGATSGNAVAANPGAAFRLPTENEWYKAAYYTPNYGGSGVAGYYAYATQSDTAPGNTIGSTANQANWFTGDGYSVTQSGSYVSAQNYLTDVGAFTNSGSFYGTFDQSGNVFQWNDLDGLASSGSSRGLRGGGWLTDLAPYLSSSGFISDVPSYEYFDIGFRLASAVSGPASVPEIDPNSFGSVLALVLGSLGLFERRRQKAA
jgi:formylglycine-generating enzyme required for sulfatase activity